jgi:hypothetical protein
MVGGLTAAVLVLGFVHLGAKSVWLDEATGLDQARHEAVASLVHGRNMGLHVFLLGIWIRLFGESETAIRSLSVVCAALCVPAVYLLGRRLFDERAGLLAAVLLVPNAFFLRWAQQARSYPLLVLLVTLSAYFFLREVDEPSWANAFAYVATSAAAVSAHYFAVFVVLAELLTLVAVRRRAALTRTWIGVAVAIGVLSLPEVWHSLRTGSHPLAWIAQPTGKSLWKGLVELGGGGWLALAALLAAGAFAVVRAVNAHQAWREGFLTAWVVLPVGLSFAASFVQPMFVSRYLLVALPALVLLAARGLTKLPSVWLAAAVAAAICVPGIRHVVTWYRADSFEDWRGAARHVLGSSRPGDALRVYPDFAQAPFDYYERQAGGALPETSGARRVWLVARGADAGLQPAPLARIEGELGSRYRRVDRRSFTGVVVSLYVAGRRVDAPAAASTAAATRSSPASSP